MKTQSAALLVALLAVIICIIVYCIRVPDSGLADKLAADGWVLFTTPGCSFCVKQLRVLGLARYPSQTECGGASAPAGCKKIAAFPFWVNTKTSETRTGLQSAAQLREML